MSNVIVVQPRVDFINICVQLFLANRMRSFFLAHKYGKRRNKNGERRTNMAKGAHILMLIFGNWRKDLEFQLLVKLNGEFFAKGRAPASFRLAHKVWWNRPLLEAEWEILINFSQNINFFYRTADEPNFLASFSIWTQLL